MVNVKLISPKIVSRFDGIAGIIRLNVDDSFHEGKQTVPNQTKNCFETLKTMIQKDHPINEEKQDLYFVNKEIILV